MIPKNWQDIINNGSDEEILALLPLIERFADQEGISALAIWPLIKKTNFALRLRTFLAVARMRDPIVLPLLIDYLREEKVTHWRLLALDAISFLPPADKSALLGQFIDDRDIIFLWGLISLLGDQGPNSLPYLVKFLAQDTHNFLKDELIAESIFTAAGNDDVILLAWSAKDEIFSRWYRYRVKWDGKRRYNIYPYADYLWQKAQQAGLDQKTFKSLYWWNRDKKSIIKI
ncbi:MAG: hypothetical protein ACOX7H_01555 [Bacillota bacterium]|jgi:hypothetical protein